MNNRNHLSPGENHGLAALAIFRAVVRENGVTRAAAKLNRVQSNVTTRIKQLEEELGAALFVRDGRRSLTPAGHCCRTRSGCSRWPTRRRDAVREDTPRGRLRLGTMESTAASRLPAVLARYHHAWPPCR
jgi:DNA-binding transcriptional LysR family regulator